MQSQESKQYSLTRYQKEALAILSIGTMLEYFDLMLFVHMAVVLNTVFFPPTDPYMTGFLSAFAFCSTYVFRPFGALFFGWLGDNIGRKSTVIITTLMMALSCGVMCILPTYAQIGFTASVLVTICRIVQGLTSQCEVLGASIYLTEYTKPPIQYPIVACVPCFSNIGTILALGVGTLALKYGQNWRLAFGLGIFIALIGSYARTTLKETPEFADAKRKLKNKLESLETPSFTLMSEEKIREERLKEN